MRIFFVTVLTLFPLSVLAGEPIPGLDVLLDQRPGGILMTERDCTRIPGASVVVFNGVAYCRAGKLKAKKDCTRVPGATVVYYKGVAYCRAPGKAISHNSSRSN